MQFAKIEDENCAIIARIPKVDVDVYTHLCVHNYISPKTVEKEEEMPSPTLLTYTGHILVYQCQCNCFVWSGNALAAFKSKTGAL